MSETLSRDQPGPRRADVDPIRDLVERLDQAGSVVSSRDPDLSRTVGQLAASLDRPGAVESAGFRTRVAYAFQDMEKLAGPLAATPPALRAEMEKLAATAPGLENNRLQTLVAGTKLLTDASLVRDIRQTANVVAKEENQGTPGIQERVAALENRARLAPALPTATPSEPARPNVQRSPAADGKAPSEPPAFNENVPPPASSEQPLSGNNSRQVRPSQTPHGQVVQAQGPGLINLAFGALARYRETQRNDDRVPTSVAERSEHHEQGFQQKREAVAVQAAERSQAAAVEAVQSFASGPGSAVLAKIQEAAKSEPGGMQAVLSEMREGGRYSGLRSQFNADMVMEKGMAAAYDKIAGSLQQYGADRNVVNAIGTQRGTTSALNAKFESLDAEIGKATSMLPSKADGKSVMDDLTDKLREVVERAVNAVKTVVSSVMDRGARAESGPSPSPH